ncbi:hypothetical protein F511_09086 [Dorcoceras hygrometricum]|nr:hypothetical protein F511_09086 [Dorcoceras hygrometricum]
MNRRNLVCEINRKKKAAMMTSQKSGLLNAGEEIWNQISQKRNQKPAHTDVANIKQK